MVTWQAKLRSSRQLYYSHSDCISLFRSLWQFRNDPSSPFLLYIHPGNWWQITFNTEILVPKNIQITCTTLKISWGTNSFLHSWVSGKIGFPVKHRHKKHIRGWIRPRDAFNSLCMEQQFTSNTARAILFIRVYNVHFQALAKSHIDVIE